MSNCVSTDAILTIGAALHWDVPDRLIHLESCEECRTRLETLRVTRSVLSGAEPVDAATLLRISAALGVAAQKVNRRRVARARWTHAIEVLLAGIAALTVVVSSGVRIDGIMTGALAVALGSCLLMGGSIVARQVRHLRGSDGAEPMATR